MNSVRFADERRPAKTVKQSPWKILIVDDEDEIHAITRLVFDNFQFEERSLEFLSAYSGAESKALLREHPDIALVLLDVVMEEETSGLEVAKFIREDLGYMFMRIVLRTGQPGQAPEREVTAKYDINDYKEKTELTVPKLFTTVLGSLRAYRDLKAIEQSRQGLEQIARGSITLFELQSLEKFATATLTQLCRLCQGNPSDPDSQLSGVIATCQHDNLHVLTGIGSFADVGSQSLEHIVPEHAFSLIHQAYQEHQHICKDQFYVDYFHLRNDLENVLLLQKSTPFNDIEQDLLRIFSGNIAVAFDNIYLNQAIVNTQKEVIFTLGRVIDTRSKESSRHVNRIAVFSYTLAGYAGVPEQEAELLRLASPMHNIGTLGIPDAILNKHPSLSQEEKAIFQTHPQIGYNILKNSKQEILNTAAMIALQHHEHWDGSGYPQGLRGDQIHIFARITHLADAFDLLMHRQNDEKNLSLDQIVHTLKQEQGKQFDPLLVDALFEHFDEFLTIHQDFLESAS
jgi:response regulator RpfG family c-di-GMP phosphodiesterase